MGIFDFFGTGILYSAITRIEKGIIDSKTYKYFEQCDSQMIRDYKEFECILISSAIATIRLNINLQDHKEKEKIQTIYLGKSAKFIRKILNKEYKLGLFRKFQRDYASESSKKLNEALLCSEIHNIFAQYLKEISEIFGTNSLTYFQEETEYDFEGTYYFPCLTNLFLAVEDFDYENYNSDKLRISHRPISSIEKQEVLVLNNFLSELLKIYNN